MLITFKDNLFKLNYKFSNNKKLYILIKVFTKLSKLKNLTYFRFNLFFYKLPKLIIINFLKILKKTYYKKRINTIVYYIINNWYYSYIINNKKLLNLTFNKYFKFNFSYLPSQYKSYYIFFNFFKKIIYINNNSIKLLKNL